MPEPHQKPPQRPLFLLARSMCVEDKTATTPHRRKRAANRMERYRQQARSSQQAPEDREINNGKTYLGGITGGLINCIYRDEGNRRREESKTGLNAGAMLLLSRKRRSRNPAAYIHPLAYRISPHTAGWPCWCAAPCQCQRWSPPTCSSNGDWYRRKRKALPKQNQHNAD